MTETDISQLHIATDIPLNDKVKFTDVKASINGREILSFDEGVPENEEPYLQGGMVILLLNHWRAELVKEVAAKGLSENVESGWKLLNGTGDASSDNGASASSESDSSSSHSAAPVLPIAAGVVILIVIFGVIIVRKK